MTGKDLKNPATDSADRTATKDANPKRQTLKRLLAGSALGSAALLPERWVRLVAVAAASGPAAATAAIPTAAVMTA